MLVIKISTSVPYDGGADTGPGYDYTPQQNDHQEEHVHVEEHHPEPPQGEWKKKLTWKEDWQKVWKTEKKQFWETKWKQVSVPVWKEFKVRSKRRNDLKNYSKKLLSSSMLLF